MSDAERRFTPVQVEVRAESGKRAIGGYAAKFDRLSQNLGGFVERIDRGFFNKSKGDGWPGVMARYNHDDNMLLGTTAAQTLRLAIDDTGLLYVVDVPNSRNDVYELVERGDVQKSSFAFITFEEDWDMTDSGFPLRSLLSGRLLDVAPVNTPAYDDTSTALASLARKFEAPLEEVRAMAAAGDLTRFFKRTDTPTPPPAPAPPVEPRRSASAALAKARALAARALPNT